MNVFHGGRSDITELRHRKSCGIYEGDAVLTGHNMLSWLESTARKTAFSTSDSIAINKALADQYLLAVQPPFFFFFRLDSAISLVPNRPHHFQLPKTVMVFHNLPYAWSQSLL